MKLEISLFKFDSKSDYLPYYKKHFIKIKNEKNLLDILNTINEEEKFFYKKDKNFCVCLNGLYTTLDLSLDEIKKDFSKELTIEPISKKRVYSDLLINEEDFKKNLEPFKEFLNEDFISLYESFKIYFYASNTFDFFKNYIGDAILLLVSHLIEENPKEEHTLLKILEDLDYTAMYHTSLENKVYNISSAIEKRINQIKEKLHITKKITLKILKVKSSKTIDFDIFEDKSNISHTFENFNIAYYKTSNTNKQTQDLLDLLKAKSIQLDSKEDDLALNTFHLNPELSYCLASRIMLEAYDKSADLLVVDDEETFYLMDYHRSELKKACGRDILIPVIHKNELQKLATGQHVKVKKTLVKHIVDPELI